MSSHHSSSTSSRSSRQPLRQRTGHGSDTAAPGGPPVHQYSGSASRASSTHHRDHAAPHYYGGNQGPAPHSTGAPGHHGSVGHRSTREAPLPRETIAASNQPLQHPYVYPPARYITSSPEPIPDRRSIDHPSSRAQTLALQTSSSTCQPSYAAPAASGAPSWSRDAAVSASGYSLQQRRSGERTSRSSEHEYPSSSGGSVRQSRENSYRRDPGVRSRDGSTEQVLTSVDRAEGLFYSEYLRKNHHRAPYNEYSWKIREIIHVARSLLVSDKDNMATDLVSHITSMGNIVKEYEPILPHKQFLKELDVWFEQLTCLETADEEARNLVNLLGEICGDDPRRAYDGRGIGEGYSHGGSHEVVRSSGSTNRDPCFDMAVTFAALVYHFVHSRADSEGGAPSGYSNQVDETALIEAFLDSDLTMAGDSVKDEPLINQYMKLQKATMAAFQQFESMSTTFGVPSSIYGQVVATFFRNIKGICGGIGVTNAVVTGVRSGFSEATTAALAVGMVGAVVQGLEKMTGRGILDPERTYATQDATSSTAYMIEGEAIQTLMGFAEFTGILKEVLDDRSRRRLRGGLIPTKFSRHRKMEMVQSLRSICKHFLPLPGQSIQIASQQARRKFFRQHGPSLDPTRVQALEAQGFRLGRERMSDSSRA